MGTGGKTTPYEPLTGYSLGYTPITRALQWYRSCWQQGPCYGVQLFGVKIHGQCRRQHRGVGKGMATCEDDVYIWFAYPGSD